MSAQVAVASAAAAAAIHPAGTSRESCMNEWSIQCLLVVAVVEVKFSRLSLFVAASVSIF